MPLKTLQFQVDPTGTKFWGVIYTPMDYDTNPDPCALICFSHGVGEAGSTQASAARVIGLSPLYPAQQYEAAGKNFAFTSPVTNKVVRFIVVALQAPSWSPSPANWDYVLDNGIYTNYRIDRNAVFCTGLSAGGATTTVAVTTTGILEHFAACVPMSPASQGNLANIQATVNAKIKSWGFSGDADGNFTANLKAFTAAINNKAPGTAKQTIYPGGHGGWNTYYNPNYKENGLNIYEWMLASVKGSVYVPPPPPPPAGDPVIVGFGTNETITGNSITIDVSASKDVLPFPQYTEAYTWKMDVQSGSWDAQATPPGTYGGPKKVWSNLKPGQYNITLTVKGVNGKTATAMKTVTIATTAPPPDPPPTSTSPQIIGFGTDETITTKDIVVDVSASKNVKPFPQDTQAYKWNFTPLGGSWGAQPVPSGIFGGPKKTWPNLLPAQYVVTLTVKGVDGTTASATKTVTVK